MITTAPTHTRGPWQVIDGHVYAEPFVRDTTVIVDGVPTPHKEGLIALVYTPMPEQAGEYEATSEANRRLIAAAPDLLDALKRARDTIRQWHGMNEPDDMADQMWQLYQSSPEMKTINAAIAKAVLVVALLLVASSAHAADRHSLTALVAASVADAITTERAIRSVPYAYESNPLLSGSQLQREVSKAACTAGLVWGLAKLSQQHPKLAAALAWTATGSLAALAAHNAAIGGR